jgi:rare lipoprotein A
MLYDWIVLFHEEQGDAMSRTIAKATAFLAAMISAAVFFGCASQQRVQDRPIGWTQSGTACWYGNEFDGRGTANGEVFDQDKLTAAHRNLPFGTYVEVTRKDNGKQVVVRINDRGPWKSGRIIDLSRAAAERLDMIQVGLVEVTLRVVRKH